MGARFMGKRLTLLAIACWCRRTFCMPPSFSSFAGVPYAVALFTQSTG
jgi:hypothetical protein